MSYENTPGFSHWESLNENDPLEEFLAKYWKAEDKAALDGDTEEWNEYWVSVGLATPKPDSRRSIYYTSGFAAGFELAKKSEGEK